MPFFRHLNLKEPKKLPPDARDTLCTACIVGIEALIDIIKLGASVEVVEEAALIICDIFHIEDHEVCQGAIQNYAPQLVYIVTERHVTGQEACAIVLANDCGAQETINGWTVALPAVPKPAVEPPTPPAPGSPTRRILQIADVHLDLSYTIGSNAACDLPNCCMNITGDADSPENAAQYWGDYRCDLPSWTFRNILEHIRDTHGDDFDYIMLTGDYPAHDVWLQSRQNNLDHTKTVMDLVKEIFPNKDVFPSMGNHESFPCNSYPTSNLQSDDNPEWLYNRLAEFFTGWLPQHALEQFKIDGFYSFDYNEELKIIAVNSNLCLTYNFYLWLEWADPANELAWLVDELLAAELAGKKVHILSHVPPGNGDCLASWGREFSKIISRFEGTVRAQFYGHTHNDEFAVFYDTEDPSRAVSTGFVAPSITTYLGLNPAYRIYTVDSGYEGASYRVQDFETYIFNMAEANLAGPDVNPIWYKLYSAREGLGMENLYPEDWDQLVRRMAVDDDLYATFHRFYNQDSFGETDNKYNVLCSLLTTSNLDKSKCLEILGPNPEKH